MNDDSVTDSVMKAVLFSCVCVCVNLCVCDNWPLYNINSPVFPQMNVIIKSLILSNTVFLSFKKCDFLFFFFWAFLLMIFSPSSSDWSKNLARRLSGWGSVLFFFGNKRKWIKTRPRCLTRTLPSSRMQLVLWHQLSSHYLYLTRKNWPRGRKLQISHHVFHGFANASRTF